MANPINRKVYYPNLDQYTRFQPDNVRVKYIPFDSSKKSKRVTNKIQDETSSVNKKIIHKYFEFNKSWAKAIKEGTSEDRFTCINLQDAIVNLTQDIDSDRELFDDGRTVKDLSQDIAEKMNYLYIKATRNSNPDSDDDSTNQFQSKDHTNYPYSPLVEGLGLPNSQQNKQLIHLYSEFNRVWNSALKAEPEAQSSYLPQLRTLQTQINQIAKDGDLDTIEGLPNELNSVAELLQDIADKIHYLDRGQSIQSTSDSAEDAEYALYEDPLIALFPDTSINTQDSEIDSEEDTLENLLLDSWLKPMINNPDGIDYFLVEHLLDLHAETEQEISVSQSEVTNPPKIYAKPPTPRRSQNVISTLEARVDDKEPIPETTTTIPPIDDKPFDLFENMLIPAKTEQEISVSQSEVTNPPKIYAKPPTLRRSQNVISTPEPRVDDKEPIPETTTTIPPIVNKLFDLLENMVDYSIQLFQKPRFF